jgi:hypothetical protein
MIFWTITILVFLGSIFLSIRFFGNLLDFVAEKSSGRGIQNGPWKTHLGVGRKSTSRIEKAAIARIGLGANDSEETIYWNAFTDQDNQDLHSSCNYRIVFTALPR